MIFLIQLPQPENIFFVSYDYKPADHTVPALIGWGPYFLIILGAIALGLLIAIPVHKNRKKKIQNDPLLIEILRKASCTEQLPVVSIFTTHISIDQEMYLFSTYNHAQLPEYWIRMLAEWYCTALCVRAPFEMREILFPSQGFTGHYQSRFYYMETFGYFVYPAGMAQTPGMLPSKPYPL